MRRDGSFTGNEGRIICVTSLWHTPQIGEAMVCRLCAQIRFVLHTVASATDCPKILCQTFRRNDNFIGAL